jgi:ACS family hexuronate transporter-like MFS transporter
MNSTNVTKTISNYRWRICALLFFATTINYIDRQVIGLLKPVLEQDFGWTETDYGYIVMSFSAAYAFGLLVFGRIIDRIGSKMGYTISVVAWSIAAMAHALARSTFGFGVARAFLGLGESGNFPAAIKATAEWFPKKERALATGIFNSGTNIGAVIAPILVPLILGWYGWQETFIITGAIGFIWVVLWIRYYEIPSRHKRVSAEELAYIHSDEVNDPADAAPRISWWKLLSFRKTWAFVIGKFLTDPIWWFFLFWLPSYFATTFQIDFRKPSLHLVIIYTATTLGSIGGGYLSGWFINRGWDVARARRTAMLVFAVCVVPIVFAQFAANVWVAVGLISLAAASHQAWSANIFTTASDMFPKNSVSSVVGIGGMAGSVGGILFPIVTGTLLDHYKALGNITAGYNMLFVICGSSYMLAWLMMGLLTKNKATAD